MWDFSYVYARPLAMVTQLLHVLCLFSLHFILLCISVWGILATYLELTACFLGCFKPTPSSSMLFILSFTHLLYFLNYSSNTCVISEPGSNYLFFWLFFYPFIHIKKFWLKARLIVWNRKTLRYVLLLCIELSGHSFGLALSVYFRVYVGGTELGVNLAFWLAPRLLI